MPKFSVRFLLLSFLLIGKFSFAGGPRIGTYLGFILIDGRTEKIGVCLEFEKRELPNKTVQLIAFLKMKLGGFATSEYVSSFYIIDDYQWDSSEIVLDGMLSGGGTDLTFWQGKVLENGERITGKIRSAHGGVIRGHAELVWVPSQSDFDRVNSIFPEIPMVRALTGQYFGKCQGKETWLQMEATKTQDPRKDKLNALAGFQLRVRTGGYSRFSYNRQTNVVYGTWENAPYNPYTGKISQPFIDENCYIKEGTITCGDSCSFKKDAPTPDSLESLLVHYKCSVAENTHHILPPTPIANHPFPTVRTEIEGEYYGVLHLEERNVYKIMSLEIALAGPPSTENGTGSWQNILSVIGRIFPTTDHGTNTEIDNSIPITFIPQEILKGDFREILLDSDGDAMLKITSWGKDGMKGILYSKSYGRAGTVEFIKGEHPDPSIFKGIHLPSALPGNYSGSIAMPNNACTFMDFRLALLPVQNEMVITPVNFPFMMRGFAEIVCKTSVVNGVIQSGALDFFTGAITLFLDADQTIMGKLTDQGIQGALLGGYANTVLRPHKTVLFKRH